MLVARLACSECSGENQLRWFKDLSEATRLSDITVSVMDGTLLASALAERLAQVLPEGFSISSTGHELWLDTPDGYGNSAWAGAVDEDPTDLSLYSAAAENVLNNIQDGVSMTLREPWPLEMVGGKRQMAMPDAKVVDGVLELWYGKEDAPALRLQPINLRD